MTKLFANSICFYAATNRDQLSMTECSSGRSWQFVFAFRSPRNFHCNLLFYFPLSASSSKLYALFYIFHYKALTWWHPAPSIASHSLSLSRKCRQRSRTTPPFHNFDWELVLKWGTATPLRLIHHRWNQNKEGVDNDSKWNLEYIKSQYSLADCYWICLECFLIVLLKCLGCLSWMIWLFQVWYRCLLHPKLKILMRASSAIIGTFPLPAGIFFSRELMVKDFKWWTKSSKSKKKLEFSKDKSYLMGICENLKYHASLVGWNWTSHFAFQIIWTQKYWMPLSWLAASL